MARIGASLPGHDGLGPLAAVLDAAAAPEVADRLDATALAEQLKDLASRLPEPAPLPLAGAGGRGVPQRGAAAHDRTEHGTSAPARPGSPPPPSAGSPPPALSAPGGSGPSDTTDAFALATAVGVATDSTLHPPSGPPGAEAEPGHRRRRWPWVVGALVVVLGLAGGGAYVAARAKLLTPSHKLPALTGITPVQAQARLHHDHLGVRVTGQSYSATVAAGLIVRQVPGAGRFVKEGRSVSVVVSSGPPPVTVPSLAALTGGCPSVDSVLAAAHLHPNCTTTTSLTAPAGSVLAWTPQTRAIEFSTVSVTVSSGEPTETVPSLTGATCTGAQTALTGVHLVGQCTNQYSTSVSSGQVISWSPTTTALAGSTVAIVVSEGPPPVTVPANLDGQTVTQAIGLLDAAGLTPGPLQGPLSGRVFDSNPAPGTSVPEGTTVTLYSK
jgi:beta-lactam-binding protein with PASTA domain